MIFSLKTNARVIVAASFYLGIQIENIADSTLTCPTKKGPETNQSLSKYLIKQLSQTS